MRAHLSGKEQDIFEQCQDSDSREKEFRDRTCPGRMIWRCRGLVYAHRHTTSPKSSLRPAIYVSDPLIVVIPGLCLEISLPLWTYLGRTRIDVQQIRSGRHRSVPINFGSSLFVKGRDDHRWSRINKSCLRLPFTYPASGGRAKKQC